MRRTTMWTILVLAAPVVAQTDSLGGLPPKVAMIPAAAFDAYPDSYAFDRITGGIGANSTSFGCLFAPAPLPHGALLTEMKVFLRDGSASEDFGVVLWTKDKTSVADATEIARIQTLGETPENETHEPYIDANLSHVVDNVNFTLYLTVAMDPTFCMDPDHSIFGVKLSYFD